MGLGRTGSCLGRDWEISAQSNLSLEHEPAIDRCHGLRLDKVIQAPQHAHFQPNDFARSRGPRNFAPRTAVSFSPGNGGILGSLWATVKEKGSEKGSEMNGT